MIEIEQGKVYRLKDIGLFVAESRHNDKYDDDLSHCLMRRITKPGGWEGWHDPLIYDRFRDQYVLREATHEDYIEYRRKYRIEIDKHIQDIEEYQDYIGTLFDVENENGGRVGTTGTEPVHE